MVTVKMHLNSVISTKGAKYCTFDMKDFNLNAPMERPKFINDSHKLEFMTVNIKLTVRSKPDTPHSAESGKTSKEDLSDLRENLSIFLLQYMKSSPKNVEGSEFHSNLLAAFSTCEKSSVVA
jgi:hypothetical protein